jgi:hypothetical protein
MDDVASTRSTNSSATATNFVFDDVVINSSAYRRALAASRHVSLVQRPNIDQFLPKSSSNGGNDMITDVERVLAENNLLRFQLNGERNEAINSERWKLQQELERETKRADSLHSNYEALIKRLTTAKEGLLAQSRALESKLKKETESRAQLQYKLKELEETSRSEADYQHLDDILDRLTADNNRLSALVEQQAAEESVFKTRNEMLALRVVALEKLDSESKQLFDKLTIAMNILGKSCLILFAPFL